MVNMYQLSAQFIVIEINPFTVSQVLDIFKNEELRVMSVQFIIIKHSAILIHSSMQSERMRA